jgi:hypothetical protein
MCQILIAAVFLAPGGGALLDSRLAPKCVGDVRANERKA